MHRKLSELKDTAKGNIEIEAKIGLVNIFEQVKPENPLGQALINEIKKSSNWQVMIPQRLANVPIYYFQPCISSNFTIDTSQGSLQESDQQLFTALQSFLSDEVKKHPGVWGESR